MYRTSLCPYLRVLGAIIDRSRRSVEEVRRVVVLHANRVRVCQSWPAPKSERAREEQRAT